MKKYYVILILSLLILNKSTANQNNKVLKMNMTESKFWAIIEQSKTNSFTQYSKNLINLLATLPDSDIYDFEIILRKKIRELHNWNTFSICSIIEIAFSDEDFLDFKCWVIAQGKDFFCKFLENPEELSEIIIKKVRENVLLRFERLLYVSDDAFIFKYKDSITNYVLPRDFADNIDETYSIGDKLKGSNIDSDEMLYIHLPKIYKGVKEFLREVDDRK